ncbi:MAG: hypothetical protein KDA49_05095 [Rhodospirillaceae bacterium]|nr:hypothetical protein [Rhodospirillaceae bacterium]
MLLTLVGTLALGLGVASLVFLVNRLVFRKRMPRWVMPAAAGAAMLAFTIQLDYIWHRSVEAGLPPDVQVTGRFGDTSWLKPWSLISVPISRIQALANPESDPDHPEIVRAEVILMQRYQDPRYVLQFFDCGRGARADLPSSEPEFGDDGRPIGAEWFDLPADHPLLQAACRGVRANS